MIGRVTFASSAAFEVSDERRQIGRVCGHARYLMAGSRLERGPDGRQQRIEPSQLVILKEAVVQFTRLLACSLAGLGLSWWMVSPLHAETNQLRIATQISISYLPAIIAQER